MNMVLEILFLLFVITSCENRQINMDLLIDGADICIPNCDNKECGDDGCGGNCGSCNNNAFCNIDKCECIRGFADCNGRWDDGCEIDLSNPATCGTGCENITNCGENTECVSGECLCRSGYYDCYIYEPDGCETQGDKKHIWSMNFGGGDVDYGQSIYLDNSGNIYIMGNFSSSTINFGGGVLTNASCGPYGCQNDIFLARFDSNGGHIWSKRFGGHVGDIGTYISIDSSDNVFITGRYYSPNIDFGGGPLTNQSCDQYSCEGDIFLAKFDRNGNHLWSKSFGGRDDDRANSVSVDSSGNVYITGYFGSPTIDFGGGVLTNAGGCFGYSCPADIYLAKFDSNGNHLWSKRFGLSDDDEGRSVSVDSSGNVYITGSFQSPTIDFGGGALTNVGNDDIFLAKFDSNGNHLWSKRFGGSDDDEAISISVDSSDNVYIAGNFESSTINFGGGELKNVSCGVYDNSCRRNIFVVKLDSRGNHIWSKSFGGEGSDEILSIHVDKSDNVYITGAFSSNSISFGGEPLIKAGHCDQYVCPDDIFLVKFDSNGEHIWSKRFGGKSNDGGNSVFVDSNGYVYLTGYFSGGKIDFGGCPLWSAGSTDVFLIKYKQ